MWKLKKWLKFNHSFDSLCSGCFPLISHFPFIILTFYSVCPLSIFLHFSCSSSPPPLVSFAWPPLPRLTSPYPLSATTLSFHLSSPHSSYHPPLSSPLLSLHPTTLPLVHLASLSSRQQPVGAARLLQAPAELLGHDITHPAAATADAGAASGAGAAGAAETTGLPVPTNHSVPDPRHQRQRARQFAACRPGADGGAEGERAAAMACSGQGGERRECGSVWDYQDVKNDDSVMCKVSTSGIRSCMCHCVGLNGAGGAVFIVIHSCVDSQAIKGFLWLCVKKHRSEWSVLKCVYGDYLSWENSSLMHAVLPAIWI